MNKAVPASLRALGRGVLLATGCAAATVPAGAQTGRDPIVVQGERLAPAMARQRATAFVRTTGVAASETPAARWTDPVARGCSGSPRKARAAPRT